jgi:hypothetical protein
MATAAMVLCSNNNTQPLECAGKLTYLILVVFVVFVVSVRLIVCALACIVFHITLHHIVQHVEIG